jgi:hypothetical protein
LRHGVNRKCRVFVARVLDKCDSPQAVGRLVALSLLADGHVSSAELKALGAARLTERLGLAPGELQTIVQDLCEDLVNGPFSPLRSLHRALTANR